MKHCPLLLALFLSTLASYGALADTLVWSGNVSSQGNSTQSIPMKSGERYYLSVKGSTYFGKWSENGAGLHNDACYEFRAKGYVDPLPVFSTNLNISVCDGRYRPDHVYFSEPFLSSGEPVRFWIIDTDHSDNSGHLFVELYRVDRQHDVMARNNCRCEDWDSNGSFGIVLNGNVLKSNLGAYSACVQLADTLPECRSRPDVIVPSNSGVPQDGGGVVARIDNQDPCTFASGGWAERRGHYNCKFQFSFVNTTGQDIYMTEGWSEVQDLLGEKVNRYRINYPKILRPGQRYAGHNACIVPHNQQTGTIRLGGAGHYRDNPDEQQFKWDLKLQCRP